MSSRTSYWPSLVPGSIGTGPDYEVRSGRFSPLTVRAGLPPAASPPADRDQACKDRERNLGRRDGAEVQTDGALDPSDYLRRHSLFSQCVQMVSSVAAAADQADEAWVSRKERLQRLHQVRRIVVGVDGVEIRT